MPLHTGKGKTIAEAISGSADYIGNPDKTLGGELVTGYECEPLTAVSEFLLSKRQYYLQTGREQGDKDVIAYHLRQSFKPGEVSPEEANRIGHEVALSLTKGRHAFIVATHVDKSHTHNHIIFNSTSLDCGRKFRNFIGSAFAVRRISDRVCLEHGLSIIENPKPSRGHYGKWAGEDKPLSYREKLKQEIDRIINGKPDGFDTFLSEMKEAGYEVKRGKYLSFKAPGQSKFTRCRESTLGADYTEEAIKASLASLASLVDGSHGERSSHKRGIGRRSALPSPKFSLLIDIQERLQAGKGPGYERWAKIFNLKQAAKTLNYLQENGSMSYEELAGRTAETVARFNALSDRLKELEGRLSDNAALQKHIINYSKTRAAYIEYRKAGYSRKFKETHEGDILIHQAAKKAFDALGLDKLPTVAALRSAYAGQLTEKKGVYREYAQARNQMKELLVVKENVDRLLDIPERGSEHDRARRDSLKADR